MKYVVMILMILLMAGSSLGYWYYRDSQKIITTLNQNNAKLETAVNLNEQTITDLRSSYTEAQQQIDFLNQENIRIKRNNDRLVDKFANSDIGLTAEARPAAIERLINRGTANAFRCLELLSGAELTESERRANNGKEFNNECPWLFDTFVGP